MTDLLSFLSDTNSQLQDFQEIPVLTLSMQKASF